MRRVVHGLAAFAALIASVTPGCLDPTEIQIDIHTDSCASLKSVEVYVGGADGGLAPAPSAVANSCADAGAKDVGSITLVPSSGIGDKITVAIVGTLFGGSCTPDSTSDPSCIIARRTLAYVPHGKQFFTVDLSSVCAGVQCPIDQTCEVESGQGVCKSTCQVGCADGGAVDAGGPSGDVGVSSDGTTGPTCVAPGPQPSGNATWVWSFPYPPGGNLQDDKNTNTQPFVSGNTIQPDDSSSPCSSYLQVGTGAQRLADAQSTLSNAHVAITAHYRAKPNVGAAIFALGSSLHAGFNVGNALVVSSVYNTTPTSITDATGASADGNWHYVYVDIDVGSNALKAWRDGNLAGQTSFPAGYANAGPLVVGASVDVDQVQVFAY